MSLGFCSYITLSCALAICWSLSAATQILVDSKDETLLDMKRQFGWKLDTTALKYVDATVSQNVSLKHWNPPNYNLQECSGIMPHESEEHSSKVLNIAMGNNCTVTIPELVLTLQINLQFYSIFGS